MNKLISFLIVGLLAWTTGCVSADPENSESIASSDAPSDGAAASDDSNSFDGELESELPSEAANKSADKVEDEIAKSNHEIAQAPNSETPPPSTQETPPPIEESFDDLPEEALASGNETPPPAPQVAEVQAPISNTSSEKIKITNIQFKSNDNGGTIVVDATGPLTYTTESKKSTHQFIIDIENASLPKSLQRPFNTKDFDSVFASIDAYEDKKRGSVKVVAQLRNTQGTPVVRSEGSALMVIASERSVDIYAAQPYEKGENSGAAGGPEAGNTAGIAPVGGDTERDGVKQILSSTSLQAYLAGNNKFYGHKISIQMNDMEVTDALKFISEESGINMVIDEGVKGTLSLKLKDVPWDQALIIILKAKKMGYSRQGNIIRIALLADLRNEEDDLNKVINAQKLTEPLKVRMVPISFADLTELITQIKPFLSPRGQVVSDKRSGSIIITDIDEGINKALKLIANLDNPPPQVLIEGKIVTAVEQGTRAFGINWSATGLQSTQNGSSTTSFTPSFSAGDKGFNFGLNVGTFKILGDLNATLSLAESNNLAKVISSPRILTLQNEAANITQALTQPYTTSQVGADGKATPQVNFQTFDMNLNVTPQITNDGSVLLKVDFSRTVPLLSAAKDSASSSQKNSAQTKVLVKNGETAVIGGIYEFNAQQTEQGVPFFKDIPVLGYLFKGKNDTKSKSELLVFVTPRIISNRSGVNLEKSSEF